jgi:hypothetical protein
MIFRRDELRELCPGSGIVRAMNSHPERAPSPRALRLKTEAGNCLTIAVRQSDPAFAAELIDEAVRLTKRARELSGDKAA